MDKKKVVSLVVLVVLGALAMWAGPDVVTMVKDAVGSAPVSSEVAPVSTDSGE